MFNLMPLKDQHQILIFQTTRDCYFVIKSRKSLLIAVYRTKSKFFAVHANTIP